MYSEEGGSGQDLLVMLHGLGATGAVWSALCANAASHWGGRWLVLDLPGHGQSGRQPSYALGQCAATVAHAVLPRLDSQGRLVVLGHSFGGVIGLALATGWFGVMPDRVFAAGIKVSWTDDEVRRLQTLATQPARLFETEAEARDRYLKVSGLAPVAAPDSAAVARGIASEGHAWRLAMDPAANGVGKPPLRDLVGLARCPIHLAVGQNDAMVTLEETRSIDPAATDLGPHGHNVMVEAPEAVWRWVCAWQ